MPPLGQWAKRVLNSHCNLPTRSSTPSKSPLLQVVGLFDVSLGLKILVREWERIVKGSQRFCKDRYPDICLGDWAWSGLGKRLVKVRPTMKKQSARPKMCFCSCMLERAWVSWVLPMPASGITLRRMAFE